jgi:two-component system sensor histidine kinase BaeS
MFKSLSARAAILTGTVAAIAVVIAGLVALPMIRGAAEIQAQVNLSAQADLVRDIAVAPEDFNLNNNGNRPGVDARAFSGIISYLNAQGVEVLTLVPGTSEPKILTADQKDVIESGRDVSARNCVGDECFLIEGRPLGVGTGVILTQSTQVVTEVTTSAIRRIAIALVVGLGVAIFIGFLAARRLSRPLREAAAGARELALGKRDLRLTPEGPTEISEIAHALNLLAEGLTRSEGRQREFLLSVSHELRTPLTAIRGYAEAMADGLVVESDRARVGAVMSLETQRLDRLVSDLLDLARTGAVDFPLNMQSVDLVDVVSDACDVWADRALREQVEFRREIFPENLPVFSDPIRVRQIIDNLAENALRVTPAGEVVVISLSMDGVVQVRDSGPGLLPEDIEVAFAPGELFEKYKGVRRVGTGFGLALVGRLAHRLGAQASAGAASEGGAAFTIDFSSCRSALN